MRSESGTPIGRLVNRHGEFHDVPAGQIVDIDSSRAIAVYDDHSGFRLLVILPVREKGLVVTRNDLRQAGAFLAAPGDNLRFVSDLRDQVHRFELLPVIRAHVDTDDRCEFCRSPFQSVTANLCTSSTLEPASAAPLLLCDPCAGAWTDE